MTRRRSPAAVQMAADLLAGMKVCEPEDIDVELVASFFDAHVVWLPLTSEAGHVRRMGDRAYIGVAESSRASWRWRFTVLHEIAHRLLHPAEGSEMCGVDLDSLTGTERALHFKREGEAEDFAAEVLMSRHFFLPFVSRDRNEPVGLDEVAMIADRLQVSLSATAIRYTELCGPAACAVVVSKGGRVDWRAKSDAFAGKIAEDERICARSLAAVLLGEGGEEKCDRIDGETERGAWGRKSGTMREQSIRYGEGALTWLWHRRL